MHPPDCPDWEYRTDEVNEKALATRSTDILCELRTRAATVSAQILADTRPFHARLFCGLTPPGVEYYAGSYRGSEHRCLVFARVGIDEDPRVGAPPQQVAQMMNNLTAAMLRGIRILDKAAEVPHARFSREHKLYAVVVFTCRAFVDFLTIHPYVNGNGHIARLIAWSILGRYGWWPERWPVEPRTGEPQYSSAIGAYRDGNYKRLEQFVLGCLIAAPTT
jgi:hypothetical protein